MKVLERKNTFAIKGIIRAAIVLIAVAFILGFTHFPKTSAYFTSPKIESNIMELKFETLKLKALVEFDLATFSAHLSFSGYDTQDMELENVELSYNGTTASALSWASDGEEIAAVFDWDAVGKRLEENGAKDKNLYFLVSGKGKYGGIPFLFDSSTIVPYILQEEAVTDITIDAIEQPVLNIPEEPIVDEIQDVATDAAIDLTERSGENKAEEPNAEEMPNAVAGEESRTDETPAIPDASEQLEETQPYEQTIISEKRQFQ